MGSKRDTKRLQSETKAVSGAETRFIRRVLGNTRKEKAMFYERVEGRIVKIDGKRTLKDVLENCKQVFCLQKRFHKDYAEWQEGRLFPMPKKRNYLVRIK